MSDEPGKRDPTPPHDNWLTKPISERGWKWITVGGLLLFGLSGFIDLAEGFGFPTLKIISTVLGVVALAVFPIGGSEA